MSELALEIKNVSKRFRIHENRNDSLKEALTNLFVPKKNSGQEFYALKNVSLELKKGEALGLIGRNGAGKSTLLRILTGITFPDEGEINFYGKPVSILDIGAGFHPELTGRENIYLSGSLYHFPKKKIDERFKEIVDFSGIENFIDEPVKNYSSGMYLRLAFSIIACLEADIYLIDEVINVGDANFQAKCKAKIEELIAKGKTLLIASHNLNELALLCNRIALIEDGKIIEIGKTDVIQRYFTIAMPEYFSFDSEHFFYLKNISELQLPFTQVKILNYGMEEYHVASEGISNRYPFKIFTEIEIVERTDIYFGLQFCDVTGLVVFTCTTKEYKNSVIAEVPGKYRIEFTIPSNLLNQRVYSVNFIFVGREKVLHKIDKFITLKVEDEKQDSDSDLTLNMPGVVKPLILSNIQKMA